MNVLIVDDIPANLKLLRALLEVEGVTVLTAADGLEALEVLGREKVDAVISDILMPHMDGYRLCMEVRKSETLKGLPFIFYTATYTSPSDEKLSRDLGADLFLKKPASSRTLLEALQQVTQTSRQAPEPAARLDELLLMKEYNQQLVTKLEQKNDELQAAHGRLRQLLEHSPAVIYRLRLEAGSAVPILVSENIQRVIGCTVEESLQPGWWRDGLHPADRARAEASLPESIEKGFSRVEYRFRRADGSYLWIEDHRRLIRNAAGDPTDVVGVWSDITERRRAELALQESDRRFREMMENVQLISMTLDTEGRVTFCNDFLLRLTGRTREEVMGANWFSVFIPETEQEIRRVFFETIQAGTMPVHFQNMIQTKTGELRLIAWNNTTLRGGNGKVTGLACIGDDITERQRHERLALRSQRLEAIGTLAGGVAHDLNNALAPIMMVVDLLRLKYPEDTGILETLNSCSHRGADMVRQLLTFARGAEGERVSMQPSHLVREMQSIIKASFPKNIQVVVDTDAVLPTVRGDATQLHQILLNLCVNARDAMPQGGTLTLEAVYQELDAVAAAPIPDAKPGRYVVLRVRDTGTGIPPEIIDRIFEPFFTTKGPDMGTGLGLSTVLGIATGHGGFLHVYSQPGSGSTFAVYLPAEGSDSGVEPARQPLAKFSGMGETILFVDDEFAIRETARMVLRGLNFKPIVATDGMDALTRLGEYRSELRAVITDLHMPHMDGLPFVRALRRLFPDLPIAVASGRMEESVAAELRALGVESRLDKPFTEMQLAEVLRSLLQGRRASGAPRPPQP